MNATPTPRSRSALLVVALVVCLVIIGALLIDRARTAPVGSSSPMQTRATASQTRPTQTRSSQTRSSQTRSSQTRSSQSTRGASTPQSNDGLRTVSLADLPPEVAQIHALLLKGGPFAYSKDGSIYRNDNRVLPSQPRGYYREFTVPTPGEGDRGARRIVVGGCGQQTDPGARRPRTRACTEGNVFYYTGDHYTTFVRILP